MDRKHLKTLGPYITVLGDAAAIGASHRTDDERIPYGKEICPEIKLNMSGSFLLYRGASMMPAWIKDWENAADRKTKYGRPGKFNMPGFSSFSESIRVALR